MAKRTSHIDTFALDGLPAEADQADYLFSLDELQFPEKLNCAVELLDRQLRQGSDKLAIVGHEHRWTYRQLDEQANRIAGVLVDDLGIVPGDRVLLRAPNCPMLAASWFGVIKAGAIAVATMPLLRAADLEPIVEKAQVKYAICDARLIDEMEALRQRTDGLDRVLTFGDAADDSLESLSTGKPVDFTAIDTFSDDIALIAFTSGTTGNPKGTMHFHRDVMSMSICVGQELLHAGEDDVFIGSPPLAFTFGLGMLLTVPLYAGATAILIENPAPDNLVKAIDEFGATVCATAPTAYRAMLNSIPEGSLKSLKQCVSAGEHLPLSTFEDWERATGIRLINGLGTTEMIHIFVSASGDEIRPGAIGKALNGYEVEVLDADGAPAPADEVGRLAVRGPTGCKYLNDDRQKDYVADGWNITGDLCKRDADGYFWYVSRADDMIISSGYNIAGPEVEAALMSHDSVLESGVVGTPDEERGQLIHAFVVLREGSDESDELVRELQEHVKSTIAPYKYPRRITFVDALPKTQTGKVQRYKLLQ